MPRPEQTEIEGTAAPKIPAIEKAGKSYVNVRDERMALTQKEVAAKEKLLQAIHDNQDKLTPNGEGKIIYRYDDMQVIFSAGKENVKVRSVDSPTTEDED